MNGLLLVVSLALLVNISLAADVCDSRGRSCIQGQAECVDSKCVCLSSTAWGDGAFGCYEPTTVVAQAVNDPVLANFNNEVIDFAYPCRYMTTHFLNELKGKNSEVIGTCEFMVYSFNAKYRGKFFPHGFDVALHIRYKNGAKVKMSSRHYGTAKYGTYSFKSRATLGEFQQNGPWGNDEVGYDDDTNDVHIGVTRNKDNHQLIYEAEKCGLRITFVPYDLKDRRAQLSIPGVSVAVDTNHNPVWMSNELVMALAPRLLFQDKVINGLSVEQSMFVRAFSNDYVQNMPMQDKGKCEATHKAFLKCTRPEVRQAMKNCYWMLKQPRFIYCMDKSKSSRNILRLFSTCIKVWCAGTPCNKAQDTITKFGCDSVRDVEELPGFMNGDMCPEER